jgi:hypothetical protein
MFLLNSSLLTFLNAGLCLLFSVLGTPCHIWPHCYLCQIAAQHSGFFYVGYDYINPLGFLIIGSALAGFGYTLYRIAVNAAEDCGLIVRAGYDLYRTDLLKQLNWKLPKNLKGERDTWMQISRFFIAERRMQLGPIKMPDYHYYNNSTTATIEVKKKKKSKA